MIGQALMGMPMEHRLQSILAVLNLGMVEMLMQSDGEDRQAAYRPQQ
jgi:hypothetical protein